jgi:uncharacterized BrkB/YihY/UPF0761 family membrane protein
MSTPETPPPAEPAPEPPERAPGEMSRGRRWSVRILVILGSIVLILAVLALWISREALDTNTYTDTSSQVLEQPAVQQALARTMVDQLYANVDVAAQLQAVLPKQAQGLAPVAAAALQGYAMQAAAALIATDRFQELWQRYNRIMHTQLVAVIDGRSGKRVTTNNGEVAIDIGPMVGQLATRLGIQPSAELANGRIVIFKADQLSTAQTLASWLKTAAYVLPFLAIILYAVAIYLATGRRRETVRACGIGIIAAGIVLILARTMIGSYIVDSLVKIPENRPAASAVWGVLTADLRDATRTVIAVGLIAVIWAWLSGAGKRAIAARRAFAPYARKHIDRVYIAFALVILLLIAWAPTNAARRWLPVVVLTVIAAIGLEAVRRQTVTEFPDAEDGTLMAGIRSHIPGRHT